MAKAPESPSTSRDAIMRLLCTAPYTAGRLADELGISANAVRKLLSRLEADGLVRYARVTRGVGKPPHEYSITATGELQVSKAYLPFLDAVLQEVEETLTEIQAEHVLRRAGRRLAARAGSGSLRQRVTDAATALNELGGAAVVKGAGASLRIECSCCAIGALVAAHPLACKSMEAFLSEHIGTPVREQCDRTGRPQCRFAVTGSERLSYNINPNVAGK